MGEAKRRLGALGTYPRGKLKEDDEGALQLAIGVRDKTIIMDFGTPVKWMGFSVVEARQLIAVLTARADEIEGRHG